MGTNTSYTITVSGLPAGIHTFAFEIDDAFFAGFEGSEVLHGKLTAIVLAERKSSFVQLDVAVAGEVTVECDRCLDDLILPVTFRGTPIVKFCDPADDSCGENDEDVIWAEMTAKDVDLTQYFYDSIVLSLPLQRVHPDGKCNKEMIAKLNELRIRN